MDIFQFQKYYSYETLLTYGYLTLFSIGVCDDHTPHYVFDYHFYMKDFFWQKK